MATPEPRLKYESPLAQAEEFRLQLSSQTEADYKSALGQFLTSAATAREMADMIDCPPKVVRVIDPGAGAGVLTAAIVERLCSSSALPDRIEVTAIESDPRIVSYLEATLAACKAFCEERGVTLTSRVHSEDFITEFASGCTDMLSMSEGGAGAEFDVAIINPPYRKINGKSEERLAIRHRGIETSNLYSAFVWKTFQLMTPGGQLVAITPRSFCNGSYFRRFREYLLENGSLDALHVYESRRSAFVLDSVLQENVIFRMTRGRPQTSTVDVVESPGPNEDPAWRARVAFEHVVLPGDSDKYIHIPTSSSDDELMRYVAELPETLHGLGLKVSTGPVVDFRAKDDLAQVGENDTVPLIYARHFSAGRIVWPKVDEKAIQAIRVTEYSRRHLLPVKHYVLVKRFSSKEEKRRVVAATMFADDIEADSVGIENHINYIYRPHGDLTDDEARGVTTFLNSSVVDQYFRRFSGHTQVNASDIGKLRWPAWDALRKLGAASEGREMAQREIDELVRRLTN